MKLYIKNMVCNRCITAVQAILAQHGVQPTAIALGEVELLQTDLPQTLLVAIDQSMKASGFELIDDRKSRIIEKIKNVVVDLVHYSGEPSAEKHSVLIASQLHYDYPYLSKLFSEHECITIEQYIILQKVEKIKEYIAYDELNLTEIACRMGYSSVAHLSAQFKKATGLPPSHFKNAGTKDRKPLDKIS